MDCAGVADCIENDETVQTALRNLFGGSNPFGNQQVGNPLDETDYNADQTAGTNPTCDYDILWAQCLATVQFFNRQIIDTFEILEVATNVIEIMDALEDLPLVKYIANFFGVSAAIELIEYFQESIAEQYSAEYTEALENELACALFCAAYNDCGLSIHTVFTVFADRITSLVTDADAIGTLVDLIEIVAGLEFDNTIVVDLAMWFCAATWKLGNFIFGRAADVTFNVLMQLSVDDASSDWMTLCTDCDVFVNGEPVIAPDWTGFDLAGTNIIDEGDGFWTIEATQIPSTAWQITIADIDGRDFSISDQTYPDEIAASCHFWRIGAADTVDCDGVEPGDPVNRYGWVWTAGAGNQRVTFKMRSLLP